MYKIALCGNPNSGKTSLFNALTGSRQHVGNWPGVTVEKKVGILRTDSENLEIVDLPGTYSLTANSIDEKIARDFIISENPDVVVVVLDQTNFERSMYLALEVLEMGKKTLLVLNMDDEAQKLGIKIDDSRLSEKLGIPVLRAVASKGIGMKEITKQLSSYCKSEELPKEIKYSRTIEDAISKTGEIFSEFREEKADRIKHAHHKSFDHRERNRKFRNRKFLEESDAVDASYKPQTRRFKHHRHFEGKYAENPRLKRWLGLKLLEGDMEFSSRISEFEYRTLRGIVHSVESEAEKSADILLAEERYGLIHSLNLQCVSKTGNMLGKEKISTRIDRIITNKWLGLPIFAGIMWLIFQLSFSIGGIFADAIEGWFGDLSQFVSINMGETALSSFISDALIGGLGSVCVFLPQIFMIFIFISFLGDIGYMARAAFVMDKIMSKFGLQGKSFISMILGFGCTIPAVMASRTLESRKDRIITVLITPLISCEARLPVYALLSGIFFRGNEGTVTFSLYFLGILLALIMAKVFSKVLFKEEKSTFIMELPPYRVPSFKQTLGDALRNTVAFLKKAGTLILGGVIVIWLLSNFPQGVGGPVEDSAVAGIGKFFAPLFAPLGFGVWQASVSLIFGVVAKEVVVGTLGTILLRQDFTDLSEYVEAGLKGKLEMGLQTIFQNSAAVYAFMVFTLLYIPCIAALGAIKKEIGTKWMLFAVFYMTVLAWVSSFIAYRIGLFFV